MSLSIAAEIEALQLGIWKVQMADNSPTIKVAREKERENLGQQKSSTENVFDSTLEDCKQTFNSLISCPPQPYLMYPHVPTNPLIGRQKELSFLTEWIRGDCLPDVRVFCWFDHGGMGKSALCYHWFKHVVPEALPSLSGSVWWSLGPKSSLEDLIIQAAAYVARRPESLIRAMPVVEREQTLLSQLDSGRFLLVLDNLEWLMPFYSEPDSKDCKYREIEGAWTDDSRWTDPVNDAYRKAHYFRTCAVSHQGDFIRRLTQLRNSHALILSRLEPADLQTQSGRAIPGCHLEPLRKLSDHETLELWHTLDIRGATEQLLRVSNAFGNCPLVIRALAGEVVRFPETRRNFDLWLKANPDFKLSSPAPESIERTKEYVLRFALRNLGDLQMRVLRTFAGFRMPQDWSTIRKVLVSQGEVSNKFVDLCRDDRELSVVIGELNDRNLLGWDRETRYELHSLVKTVVWSSLRQDSKRNVAEHLYTFFRSRVTLRSAKNVTALEDLSDSIELFSLLVTLEQFGDALSVFHNQLESAMLWRLGRSRHVIELLDDLKTGVLGSTNKSSDVNAIRTIYASQAMAYQMIGEPTRAVNEFRKAESLGNSEVNDFDGKIPLALHLAVSIWWCGGLVEAESIVQRGILAAKRDDNIGLEGRYTWLLGISKAARGCFGEAATQLRRSALLVSKAGQTDFLGVIAAFSAVRFIWMERASRALSLVKKACEEVNNRPAERDSIRATRLYGQVQLSLGNLDDAQDRLERSLNEARLINLVEEEIQALTALAELFRAKKDYFRARDCLSQVWSSVEKGPFPLLNSDAQNALARLARDEGNDKEAIAAATRAYRLAWCDGPPFAYYHGLVMARRVLRDFRTPEPVGLALRRSL
jgi:tetratricopeptide (TPR) repeat protein